MIPVSGLEQVNVAWLVLLKEGYVLYGFLLYTDSDRAVVDYMSDGIFELDVLSGEECAVFVIESPSERWIAQAKHSDHTWWRLFGEKLAREAITEKVPAEQTKTSRYSFSLIQKVIVQNNSDSTVVIGDDNTVALAHIIQPKIGLLYNRAEALKVARHFGVYGEVPCLIFFKELDGSVIWKKQLEELDSQQSLKRFFRAFFESSEFTSMLTSKGLI
jgi:hypothetical protein